MSGEAHLTPLQWWVQFKFGRKFSKPTNLRYHDIRYQISTNFQMIIICIKIILAWWLCPFIFYICLITLAFCHNLRKHDLSSHRVLSWCFLPAQPVIASLMLGMLFVIHQAMGILHMPRLPQSYMLFLQSNYIETYRHINSEVRTVMYWLKVRIGSWNFERVFCLTLWYLAMFGTWKR